MVTVSSKVSVKWVEGTMMNGMDSHSRPIVIGGTTSHEQAWQGVKPSDLLLMAAASCSMYDVITILNKQREPVEKLDIICTGDQLEEAPYSFVGLHLHYIATGNIAPEKLARAIKLSEEKYCSVISTLKPALEITSDFEINPGRS